MLSQTIRLLVLAGTAFAAALALTPIFIKILDRFHLHKQIRSQESDNFSNDFRFGQERKRGYRL